MNRRDFISTGAALAATALAGCGGGTKGSAALTTGPTASPLSTTFPEVLDSTAMAAR